MNETYTKLRDFAQKRLDDSCENDCNNDIRYWVGYLVGLNALYKELYRTEETLEKQIPKKPQYVDTRFRHHGREISDGSSLDKCYKCPNCNSHIFHVFDSEKCCKYCGQALDWSDNNA